MAVSLSPNRPRNVDWRRAAALLYGDWGTSKAYVIGLAFVAAGYASLPIIIAVSALTAIGVMGLGFAVVAVVRRRDRGDAVIASWMTSTAVSDVWI